MLHNYRSQWEIVRGLNTSDANCTTTTTLSQNYTLTIIIGVFVLLHFHLSHFHRYTGSTIQIAETA